MECFRNLTPLHSMVTTHMIILIHPLALSYMNGLITCIHSPMPHQLCWCSVNVDMTFWGYSGRWWTPIVQVYSVPGVINLPALSSPADHGRVYMRDFSVQHPALDDVSPTSSRRYHLTHWNTEGATHARGGTLDCIATYGLVSFYVSRNSIPSLFSDRIALSLQNFLPTQGNRLIIFWSKSLPILRYKVLKSFRVSESLLNF